MNHLPTLQGSLGGPWAERPLGVSVLTDWLCGAFAARPQEPPMGSGPWSSRDGQPPVPAGLVAWATSFVRHQHLKMSNRFPRVRSGSLPSFPFSFFNSSCLCPSYKLPLSPWGRRRAVSLFPSQTSVSINSCARSTSSFWAGLRGGSALFIWRGSASLLLWSWPARNGCNPGLWEPWAGGWAASARCSLGPARVGRAAALHGPLVDPGSALLAGLPWTGDLTSLSLFPPL